MTEADTKRLAEIRERTEDWCREDNDSQEGCHTLIDTDIPWLLDLVARLQELIDRAECPECGRLPTKRLRNHERRTHM